jgi:hypothetical protein
MLEDGLEETDGRNELAAFEGCDPIVELVGMARGRDCQARAKDTVAYRLRQESASRPNR